VQKWLICFSEPLFGGLINGNVHLYLEPLRNGKPVVDFLLAIIELLSLAIAEAL